MKNSRRRKHVYPGLPGRRDQKGRSTTKKYRLIALAALLMLTFAETSGAASLFGPPQTVSREAGGLNTSVGYWYSEDKFKNGSEYIFRKSEVYTQVSFGGKSIWEIYGRIGVADLRIGNAFGSNQAATVTAREDFTENWKFFGTLGAKSFLPVGKIFGIGAFVQGSYYFNNFTDDIVGTTAGVPFAADLQVRNMWNVNCGLGFQALVPGGIKVYAGPYIYYAEAEMRLAANIPGIEFGTDGVLLKNGIVVGGFIGADVPLIRGFHLHVEGQYSERLSCGAAVSYVY